MIATTLHLTTPTNLANALQRSPRLILAAAAELGIVPAIVANGRPYFDAADADRIAATLTPENAMGKPRSFDLNTFRASDYTPKPKASDAGPRINASTPTPAKPAPKIDPREAWENVVDVIQSVENVDRVTAARLAAKRYPERRAALVAAANRPQ